MINLKFKYLEKECTIPCQKTDKMKLICQQYATQNKLDFLSKIFIHNNRKINLKNNFSISKLLDLENSNKTTFDIIVFDDPDKELITRTAIYNGEEIKIQSRKNENIMNKIANIFSKKVNKFFVLSQGDIVTNEAKFNQLSDAPILINDNEERNSINSLNGDNKLPLLPDLIKNNNNNNTNKNNNNENNANIPNEKIYNPPNEKIYIPPNEKIELKDKNEEEKDENKEEEKEKENENEDIKDIKEDDNGRTSSLRFANDYENNVYKLRKLFLFLIIQFTIIFSFVYFGFLKKINEVFINGLGPILGTFIPTTIVVLLLALFSIALIEDDDDSICWYFSGYSLYIIYIFSITFYCFLLTRFTEEKYIICALSQILYQYFAIELYFFIFKSTNSLGFFIIQIIVNVISILCFYFFWINESIPIVIISSISFVYIIYLTIAFSIWKNSYEINDIQIYIAVFFNFGIFLLFDLLIVILFLVFIYYPIKCCRSCFECCDDCCYFCSDCCCNICDCCEDC